MTRDEREAELTDLASDQPGREKLLDIFIATFGYGESGKLPQCNSPQDAINAILAKEFPGE